MSNYASNDPEDREKKVSQFLEQIRVAEEQAELEAKRHQQPAYKRYMIDKAITDTKEDCASRVICKVYQDAIPMDDEYKYENSEEIQAGFRSYLLRKDANGVYSYIQNASKKSAPAKMLLEAVDDAVEHFFHKYYEDLQNTDVDEKLVSDTDVKSMAEQITSDLDYDQISQIIKDNVEHAVQTEVNQTKAEDEKVKELEQQLANDPNIVTEEAINQAMHRAGYGKKKVYEPSLFNGIMIGRTTILEDVGVDEASIGKEAFVESVMEYTGLELLSVMKMQPLNFAQQKELAREYASGK